MQRVLVTILAAGIWIATTQVPLPFANVALVGEWLAWGISISTISIAALGSAPLAIGFLLVELGSMFLVRGRARVRGGPVDREVLWRLGVVVSLGFAALQGWGLALGYEHLQNGYEPVFVYEGSPWLFRVVITLTLVTTTALLVGLVRWVGRAGVGHGFAVFLLVEAVQPWFEASHGPLDLQRLLPLGLLFFLAAALFRFARPPLLLWGLAVPLSWAAELAVTTKARWTLEPLTLGYAAALALASFVIVVWASRRPAIVATLGSPDENTLERRVTRARRTVVRAAFWTLLVLGGLVGAIVLRDPEIDAIVGAGSVAPVLLGAALAVDLVDEVLQRRRGDEPWVAAWPVHQPYKVGPAIRALERAGIAHFLRGIRYRMLQGPWDPRVPIDVMVPESQLAKARETLAAALTLPDGSGSR